MPTMSSAGRWADFRLLFRSRFRLILKLLLLVGLLFLADHLRRTQDFIKFVPNNLLPKPAILPLTFNDSGAPQHCYCNEELVRVLQTKIVFF